MQNLKDKRHVFISAILSQHMHVTKNSERETERETDYDIIWALIATVG